MESSASHSDAFLSNLLKQLDEVDTPVLAKKTITPIKTDVTNTQSSADDFDMAAFLEGSESWDLNDFTMSPVKKPSKFIAPATPPYTPDLCTRLIIKSVSKDCSNSRWRKCLSCCVESTSEPVTVYLHDDWYNCEVQEGDICNVIGEFGPAAESTSTNPRSCITITSQANLFIIHPDILLTATALSNAPECRRKPIISGLIRSSTDTTPSLVWGNVLHEVMQKCLLEETWADGFIERLIEEIVRNNLGELLKIGLDEEVAKKEVKDRARGLKLFASKYLHDEPQVIGTLANTRSRSQDVPSLLAITKILEIEEDIWSPRYGLKGKLDATVQGIFSDPTSPSLSSSRKLLNVPIPLEIKTGRAVAGMEHRAQTMLYTLLVTERYGADVQDGLLFYTQSETGEISRVPRGRHELRGLINARNEIAAYMWRRIRAGQHETSFKGAKRDIGDQSPEDFLAAQEIEAFLPPPIDDERTCTRCYVQDACFLFRKTHPDHYGLTSLSARKPPRFNPPVPSFLEDLFHEKTGHLTASQTKFFRDWEHLLSLEEHDLIRFKKELWTMGAAEREKKGRCFSGMVLVKNPRKRTLSSLDSASFTTEYGHTGPGSGNESKIHRFTYTLRRSSKWLEDLASSYSSPSPPLSSEEAYVPSTSELRALSFLNGHLNVGDPITVSTGPLLALARGYILEITPEEVTIGVDHMLSLENIRNRLNQEADISKRLFNPSSLAPIEILFRIDKDELSGGMQRIRNNLAHLFYVDGDHRRLKLVVDLKPPVFSDPTPQFLPSPSTSHLNECQLEAMYKALSAEDYALILGMPGTGKTTVIAALIQELVGRGKTVLLTSYTHSAVDTILMKLDANNCEDNEGSQFKILRLGNVDKVHPDMRKYTMSAKKAAKSLLEYETQIMSPPVVATTCLSIEHPLFSRRKFDYCIVDEASQITLPTCLGPLRFADVFVLVGDHFQLPPLVKNRQARKGGLDVSLFRRLSEAHPSATVDLNRQYRMNADIMLLSNHLIYDNRLRCGSADIAKQSLIFPEKAFLQSLHPHLQRRACHAGCWLEQLANPTCKAVFVDTDSLPAHDSRVGDLVQNTTEANLVYQFCETLVRSGINESKIGVISLYRQQVKLLQNMLQNRPAVEVLTADRSQGRDKDVIIISLVRSNDDGLVGDLVKDWRRMNVSFTRAKKKLVLFGSRKTLQQEPLLTKFFSLMESKDWILTLPKDADSVHATVFESFRPNGVEPNSCTRPGHHRKVSGKENAAQVASSKLDETCRPAKRLNTGITVDGLNGIIKGRHVLHDLVGQVF